MSADITLHMIGHGHIDPTWLWRWTEGFEEVRATFRSALDRMEETPGFYFTASSACFYAWVQQVDPELFAAIRERVREGRWEVAGGFWIEPDCNIPSGESFVRQGLYGLRYFARELGVQVRVGFNPDSFGHTGMLPQMLKKLGLDYYVYQRPMPETEMAYPDGTTFYWEAPDGSRVLTTNLIESYNGNLETSERIRQWPRNPHLTPGQKDILCFYGVGNHGGGPTKAAIHQIQEAQRAQDGPRVEFSTLQRYFEATEKSLPDVPPLRNELQYHARGCYSAHAAIKRLNRRTEHALMSAERIAVAAMLATGAAYPAAALEAGWKDLLYNQFHDILAGTSLESSYEDARDQMGRARHTAHEIINLSVQRIARAIDTTPAGNTIVVVNPLPWPVRVPVTVSPVVARELQGPLRLVDGQGRRVPVQAVRGESITAEAVAQARHAFIAEVPGLGYRCYHARDREVDKVDPVDGSGGVSAGPAFLENSWWRLELDPHTGEVSRLLDKQRQVEVLHRGGMLCCVVDGSDTWSHEVKEYRVEAGRFGQARLSVVEQGPVLATVQAVTQFGRSTAIAEWTLFADAPDILYSLRVDWREAYSLLKVGFDTRIGEGSATYETAYGHQVRPAKGHEEPGQQWIDLSGSVQGASYGLAILNDGQYSFDVLQGEMRVTLFRSPAYAHHDPARVRLDAMPSIMDQGWHDVRLRLVPHADTWREADVPRLAWLHNVPPIVHCESAHAGSLPPAASFVELQAEHVVLGVVKQAEDGEGLVVRAYETHGKAGEASFRLPSLNQEVAAVFQPYEIKTLRIDAQGQAAEVGMLESL